MEMILVPSRQTHLEPTWKWPREKRISNSRRQRSNTDSEEKFGSNLLQEHRKNQIFNFTRSLHIDKQCLGQQLWHRNRKTRESGTNPPRTRYKDLNKKKTKYKIKMYINHRQHSWSIKWRNKEKCSLIRTNKILNGKSTYNTDSSSGTYPWRNPVHPISTPNE